MSRYPEVLNSLIHHLKKLPGVGQKTAERFAFQLIEWNSEQIQSLSHLLSIVQKETLPCGECGCFLNQGKCSFCESSFREKRSLCITSCVKDVYAIEATHIFSGIYHVVPKLSPLHGHLDDKTNVEKIKNRIQKYQITEVIIALDSTLEGDATSLYLKEELGQLDVSISRLALGLPLGSSLDFVDEGTLNRAFLGRQRI